MDTAPERPVSWREAGEMDVTDYRAVSGLAVAGLAVGLASLAALVEPACWPVALAGILLCAAALGRIARHAPRLIGRKAAIIGLALSVFCGAVATAWTLTYEHLVQRQAQRFVMTWFQVLARQRPDVAHELSMHPVRRKPLDRGFDALYRDDETRRKGLARFVADRFIQTLLKTGSSVEVRYCGTEKMSGPLGSETIEQIYSVAYDEAGSRKERFVRFRLLRLPTDSIPGSHWAIDHVEPDVQPTWL